MSALMKNVHLHSPHISHYTPGTSERDLPTNDYSYWRCGREGEGEEVCMSYLARIICSEKNQINKPNKQNSLTMFC